MAHLTSTQRLFIENHLNKGESLRSIAKSIGKAHTTISREILKHCMPSDYVNSNRISNCCRFRLTCQERLICPEKRHCKRKCSSCLKCNTVCPNFSEEICEKLELPPYVCNGCASLHKCTLKKKVYINDKAQSDYKFLLVKAREGANINEEQLLELNNTLSDMLNIGQSVHHVLATNKDSFNISEKTVYRYINSGMLPSVKRYDLPKAVTMKPRKSKPKEYKVDKKCQIGRTYEDYNKFCETNPNIPIVEMDSVLGGKSGKVLLTMNLNICTLMLAFIREANTSKTVIDTFNDLEEKLGIKMFKKIFPVILTDNGSEFSNPEKLEFSHITGERRTKIFYCHPYSSWQKGHVENNHTNLRKIFPKGESFLEFTQSDINIALSHMNSFARESLNDIPAITLFETIYGKEILPQLGINLIEAKKIYLSPKLFQ